MAKLIYLYTTGGADGANPNVLSSNYRQNTTTNKFALSTLTDGMCQLVSDLPLHSPHICRSDVFIDSAHSPGVLSLGKHCRVHVVPSIWYALPYLTPGDFLIVRGGFRNWLPFLRHVKAMRTNWILFYRANTPNGHWPFWDVTLNDLISAPSNGRSGLHVPFNKPVNESVFGYIDSPNQLPPTYDVMIGASHIHNKKGQYLTVQALRHYNANSKTPLRSVLTGGFVRSSNNQSILDAIADPAMNIYYPGAVSRQQLALLMNQTNIFAHGGTGGQNDRGALEASACGCQVVLANESSAAPFLRRGLPYTNDPCIIARRIQTAMTDPTPRAELARQYQLANGYHTVCLPQACHILDTLQPVNPNPSNLAVLEASW